MQECPVCYNVTIRHFKNPFCNHSWCISCHEKLIIFNHTTCVMCRHPIFLKKKLHDANDRLLWSVNGGKVTPRWFKKYRKRLSNSVVKYKLK